MPRNAARSKTEIETTLEALADTPKQIARIARGCNNGQLRRKPSPDAWSASDIVAHLRARAEVWGRSIDRMIAEERPTIRYVSPRSWIRKTDYLEQEFGDSLRHFSEARSRPRDTLRALPANGWSRGATFTGTTLGRDATVLSHARRIAAHEVGHLYQLRRTLGS